MVCKSFVSQTIKGRIESGFDSETGENQSRTLPTHQCD